VTVAHVYLVAFFLAYFPFTHMTHAYMKYFMWHGIRWDDQAAIFDPRSGKSLSSNVARTASWPLPTSLLLVRGRGLKSLPATPVEGGTP
jgi:hypothetical protein